jgi:hypothetical protein
MSEFINATPRPWLMTGGSFYADDASIETPAMRWLSQNGPAINRAYAEMVAEQSEKYGDEFEGNGR